MRDALTEMKIRSQAMLSGGEGLPLGTNEQIKGSMDDSQADAPHITEHGVFRGGPNNRKRVDVDIEQVADPRTNRWDFVPEGIPFADDELDELDETDDEPFSEESAVDRYSQMAEDAGVSDMEPIVSNWESGRIVDLQDHHRKKADEHFRKMKEAAASAAKKRFTASDWDTDEFALPKRSRMIRKNRDYGYRGVRTEPAHGRETGRRRHQIGLPKERVVSDWAELELDPVAAFDDDEMTLEQALSPRLSKLKNAVAEGRATRESLVRARLAVKRAEKNDVTELEPTEEIARDFSEKLLQANYSPLALELTDIVSFEAGKERNVLEDSRVQKKLDLFKDRSVLELHKPGGERVENILKNIFLIIDDFSDNYNDVIHKNEGRVFGSPAERTRHIISYIVDGHGRTNTAINGGLEGLSQVEKAESLSRYLRDAVTKSVEFAFPHIDFNTIRSSDQEHADRIRDYLNDRAKLVRALVALTEKLPGRDDLVE